MFGALFRAASFPDLDNLPKPFLWVEETLRVFKDIFWISAFLLIILYWVELQTFAFQQNKRSVDKLRPRLYAMIIAFTIVRVAQGGLKVADDYKATNVTVALYVCYALTISFLAFVFVYGGVRGRTRAPPRCRKVTPRPPSPGRLPSLPRRCTALGC